MISQQLVQNCFEKLKNLRNIKEIAHVIDEFQPIEPPQLDSISLNLQASPSPVTSCNPFVPAPDLLRSYQQTFQKANQNQRILNSTNYKLKANFGQPAPRKNQQELPHNNAFMMEQPVILEQRELNILQQLRDKQIEATLPNMEATLFQHEMGSLQRKEVMVEHTLSLRDWKKLRSKLDTKIA